MDRACLAKASADADLVATVEGWHEARVENESKAEGLREPREALASERECSDVLTQKEDIAHKQKENVMMAKGRAEDELPGVRHDMRDSRDILVAERERSEALKEKAKVSDKHLEEARALQK